MRTFAILLFFLGAANSQADLRVTVEARSVEVSGLTPGASCALLGIAREPQEYQSKVVRQAIVLPDADADGVATLTLESRNPLKSIWAAVDMATGQHALGFPRGYNPEPFELSATTLRAELAQLDFDADSLDLLLVRPGAGAWTASALDGGSGDADSSPDRRIRANVLELSALTDAPPLPPALIPGDVLIAVDADRMRYLAIRIER